MYRRQDVLGFLGEQFPEHAQTARSIYDFKRSETWRQRILALLDQPDDRRIRQLRDLTEGVLAFWHAAMAALDRAILRGTSVLPVATGAWQAENQALYGGYFEGYLSRLGGNAADQQM
jgi:hypothetical protein